MIYFSYEHNEDAAIQHWENSQFDLSDVVLALTDNHIFIGAKIYAVFCRPEVLNLMQYYVCDFAKIKHDLGILDNYVARYGDVYSKSFNPSRNITAISLTIDEMKHRAIRVYKRIMEDLSEIAQCHINN